MNTTTAARKPRDLASTVPARDLHSADTIVAKNGAHLFVSRVTVLGARTKITTDAGTWTVDSDRAVWVRTEHVCDCNGSGTWVCGPIVNGVPTRTGECYGCRGKGYRTRQDAIRCATYWAKYARI